MDFLTTELLWGLLTIVFIDLILAGDNAIVIGMAARNLPATQQKTAIFWGTFGAIGIRFLSTVVVVWLLQIPALMLIGGILLLWIAYKLLTEKKDHEISAETNIVAAVRTIVIADGVMGIDNVMAVAGVAHGNLPLVITGILITIPIIIWGSTAFIKVVERFPMVIYLGGAVLAWTAGGMLTGDPLVTSRFNISTSGEWVVNSLLVVATLAAARAKLTKTA